MFKIIKKRLQYKKEEKKRKAKTILKGISISTIDTTNISNPTFQIKLGKPEEFYKIGIAGLLKYLWKSDLFIGKIPLLKTIAISYLILFALIIYLFLKI